MNSTTALRALLAAVDAGRTLSRKEIESYRAVIEGASPPPDKIAGWEQRTPDGPIYVWSHYGNDLRARAEADGHIFLPLVYGHAESYQQRVDPWLLACFGDEIARDKQERNHRFLEEAVELAQACDCTASEAHQLVDYVFGRPAGERAQEVGGVMVTLAALCLSHQIDMHEAGEVELKRIWTKVEKIREKQRAKPKHSPLPAAMPEPTVRVDLLRNLQAWLVCRTIGTALQPDLPTVQRWVAALGAITGEAPKGWTVDGRVVTKEFDEGVALHEMAKHAHRALNAAANALLTVEDDIEGDETVEQLRGRCASIACSLFTLLRGAEVDRYESAPFAALPLATAPTVDTSGRPAAAAAVAAPTGWQLVPIVPTIEMLDRGHHKIDFDRSGQNTEPLVHDSHKDAGGCGTTIEQDMRDAWAAM
ncbi:MAG TPA: hypothetical protein VIP05_23460, partial [Burkholderiaceae bacterium]